LNPNTPDNFLATFAQGCKLNPEHALVADWQSVDFLFQLTDDEVRATAGGNQQFLFDSKGNYNGTAMESYLFIAIALDKPHYKRSELSDITRAVNRLFPMPVMVLFRHGETLSLAVIRRRLHKREESRDVLEKVTLIKDIRFASPHRAHVEILFDLSFNALYEKHGPASFIALHTAWQKALDTAELNKRFYQEVANWYFWALENAHFPKDAPKDSENRDAISLIRLLTRLIFCWFIKEKGLIPDALFNERQLGTIVNNFTPRDSANRDSNYYKAILQNLFFATLNTEMDVACGSANRRFSRQTRDDHMIHTIWRHEKLIVNKEAFLALLKNIPFLNGGLFECLDDRNSNQEIRIDGFSDTPKSQPIVPDLLFFGPEREVDLSAAYNDKKFSHAKVRGLIHIFEDYKFTIEENTPIEEDVALDPELLGHVFENLLAAYNPETGLIARKTTGSFYTPRVIVGYMVDESLLVYLTERLLEKFAPLKKNAPALETKLRDLFDWQTEGHQLSPTEVECLISAIHALKAVDIACGSGAFPMGLLLKLVWILRKLDPGNTYWRNIQLAAISDANFRAAAERVFIGNLPDYTRKLYLIENCLYGVDIQPIAVQIAKLRFFISLVVDQKVDDSQPNRGVLALPNLETRIVAANSLLGLKRGQLLLTSNEVNALESELGRVRHNHFNARRYDDKKKLRKQDHELCEKLAHALTDSGIFSTGDARKLAEWDPYDQNASAGFFDPEWMFGLTTGFDISIGNPPFVRQEMLRKILVQNNGKEVPLKNVLKERFECFSGTCDLYVYFYERSLQLLKKGGIHCFISSNSFLNSNFGESLRTYLQTKTRIHLLVDFAETGVFTAITEPCIIVASKDVPVNTCMKLLQWDEAESLEKLPTTFAIKAFSLPQCEFRKDGWRLESPIILRLLEHLRRSSRPLLDIVKGSFYRGIVTGANEVFVINGDMRERLITQDRSSADIIKPFVRGRDVKRWNIESQDQWLIFTRRGINIKKYPAIHDYLKPFRKQLTPGSSGGRKPGNYEWYEIQDNIAYWQEFETPKIVYQDIARYFGMAWDDTNAYLANTCYFIPRAEKWLLGILLSSTILFYVQKVLGSDEGGFIRLFSIHVEKFPIPQLTPLAGNQLERIVEYIIMLHNQLGASSDAVSFSRDKLMAAYFEQLLNGLVYELYFPDELHAQKLTLFDYVTLENMPALSDIPETQRLGRLREIFEKIYASSHPIRGCLFSLKSLEPIRIIEGEK